MLAFNQCLKFVFEKIKKERKSSRNYSLGNKIVLKGSKIYHVSVSSLEEELSGGRDYSVGIKISLGSEQCLEELQGIRATCLL